jgi:predicted HicB family RNase H-like nuclease
MTLLRYKDFQGSAEIEDGKIVIQVLHIEDTVIGECLNALEVQKTFEELVDDYLETCEELGKSPSKPFKGSFNVRVTPALHRAMAMCAAEANESMNEWIVRALGEAVENVRAVRRYRSMSFVYRRTLSHTWPSESPVVRATSKILPADRAYSKH